MKFREVRPGIYLIMFIALLSVLRIILGFKGLYSAFLALTDMFTLVTCMYLPDHIKIKKEK